MVKPSYIRPAAEIICFENEDIITTSGDCYTSANINRSCKNKPQYKDSGDVVQSIWDVGRAWFGGGDDEDVW